MFENARQLKRSLLRSMRGTVFQCLLVVHWSLHKASTAYCKTVGRELRKVTGLRFHGVCANTDGRAEAFTKFYRVKTPVAPRSIAIQGMKMSLASLKPLE